MGHGVTQLQVGAGRGLSTWNHHSEYSECLFCRNAARVGLPCQTLRLIKSAFFRMCGQDKTVLYSLRRSREQPNTANLPLHKQTNGQLFLRQQKHN